MTTKVRYQLHAILPDQTRLEVAVEHEHLMRRGAAQALLAQAASSLARAVADTLQEQDGVVRQRRRP